MGALLVSASKPKEAVFFYKKGYDLASSINYPNGLIANALGLIVIYNDRPDPDSAAFYLAKSNEIFTIRFAYGLVELLRAFCSRKLEG